MLVKISLTAGIILGWAFLFYVVSTVYQLKAAGLDEVEHKRAIRWLDIKAGVQTLLITALALGGVALVWGWIAL